MYEVFEPKETKRIWDRFEFIYTLKHESWLNMSEIEFNVLNRQYLNKKIDSFEAVKEEIDAGATPETAKRLRSTGNSTRMMPK